MSPGHPQEDYEYTTLMNMLHVSVSKHLLDEHFTLVWANDFYYDLIGYPKEEYETLYHNRPDLYHQNDLEDWAALGGTVMKALEAGESGYTMLTPMRRKDGSYVWVQLAATFVDEEIDGKRVSYSVMTNVDEAVRMRAEQSVTYDSLPGFVGKFRVDEQLNVTLLDANERFVQFFGEDCWKGSASLLFRENLARSSQAFQDTRALVLAGETLRGTVRMQGQRGNDAWLQINASCVDRQGNSRIYLAIYIDITNETELRAMQKQLEEQAEQLRAALEQAEYANRAKTDFLSHMSHDIRTPMNAIVGMTDIAKTHLDDKNKVRDCLKKISLSSQHLLGLINDVLDMSRIESGRMSISVSSVSLPALLENVVSILQPSIKTREQKFAIHLHSVRHEQFCTDPLRLRQIFINILSNASKFTPAGGEIAMEVEELAEDRPGTARFRFTFRDTGMGMKPDFLEHLFDAFAREQDSRVDRTEGSGLGMAITKKLVDLLGGEIEVHSTLGEGSTFQIALPLEIEAPPVVQTHFPDLRVVVVDDDDVMCEYMEENLRKLGVMADSVGGGAEALELIAAADSRGEPYDAVFLDWKMPDMDGQETARRIREQVGRVLPILIVSAYDWSDIEEEAHAASIDGFISKPLFTSTLCRALQKYVLGQTPLSEAEEAPEGGVFAGRRFLLVEDNELNREIALELLNDAGAEMECARDGAEGVVRFVQAPAGWYDLVLMDIQMPVLNGYEAARRIRALDRPDAATVPILAMTADAFAEDIAKAQEAGMDGHLAKPLDTAVLKREIARVLKH